MIQCGWHHFLFDLMATDYIEQWELLVIQIIRSMLPKGRGIERFFSFVRFGDPLNSPWAMVNFLFVLAVCFCSFFGSL